MDYFLIIFLSVLFIQGIFQIRNFKVWPDWDSSNHLYFAFLRHQGVSFKSSYGPGIKWLYPRLYAILWPVMDKNPGRFRLVNFVCGILSLSVLATVAPDTPFSYATFLLTSVLFINSGYINAPTSATEFMSAPLLLSVLYVMPTGSLEFLLLKCILIAALVFGLKIIEILYIIPLFISEWEYLPEEPLTLLCFFIPLGVALFIIKKKARNLGKYSSKRRIINPKTYLYLSSCPLFFILMIFMTYMNVVNGGVTEWMLLGVLWLNIFLQQAWVFYFWYPLLLANIFLSAMTGWYMVLTPDYQLYVMAFVLCWHSLPLLLFKDREFLDAFIRGTCFRRLRQLKFFWTIIPNALRNFHKEKEVLLWISENIPQKTTVYLWGSKVRLLLLSQLIHLPDTFYNHNHLCLWSDIGDPEGYAVKTVERGKPRYIIESEPINGMVVPEELHTLYKVIYNENNTRIFELKA